MRQQIILKDCYRFYNIEDFKVKYLVRTNSAYDMNKPGFTGPRIKSSKFWTSEDGKNWKEIERSEFFKLKNEALSLRKVINNTFDN